MSRKELVAWVADVLDVDLSGLEQVSRLRLPVLASAGPTCQMPILK